MNDQLRSEVLHRWHGGQSARSIAHDLGCSRKTVTKVIAEHHDERSHGVSIKPRSRKRRNSLVDAHEATLQDYLARYPDISVVRLLEELRRRGYAGGYTVLRQRVNELRKRTHPQPVERFETGPGVERASAGGKSTIMAGELARGAPKTQTFVFHARSFG